MTPPTARLIRKPRTLCAVMSSRSKPFDPWSCCAASLMCRFQYLVRSRVMNRQKWQRIQIAEEISQPESADRNRDHDIGHRQGQGLRKIRLDDPEKIRVAHDHHPDCQPD